MHHLFAPHSTAPETTPLYFDRNPDIFADIVNHLQGYTIHIKDEVHRNNLLKEAQFYSLKGLREKLLTSRKTIDGFGDKGSAEVLLWLKDIRNPQLIQSRKQLGEEISNTSHLQDMTDESWRPITQL